MLAASKSWDAIEDMHHKLSRLGLPLTKSGGGEIVDMGNMLSSVLTSSEKTMF
jgi:hypothetical protein